MSARGVSTIPRYDTRRADKLVGGLVARFRRDCSAETTDFGTPERPRNYNIQILIIMRPSTVRSSFISSPVMRDRSPCDGFRRFVSPLTFYWISRLRLAISRITISLSLRSTYGYVVSVRRLNPCTSDPVVGRRVIALSMIRSAVEPPSSKPLTNHATHTNIVTNERNFRTLSTRPRPNAARAGGTVR